MPGRGAPARGLVRRVTGRSPRSTRGDGDERASAKARSAPPGRFHQRLPTCPVVPFAPAEASRAGPRLRTHSDSRLDPDLLAIFERSDQHVRPWNCDEPLAATDALVDARRGGKRGLPAPTFLSIRALLVAGATSSSKCSGQDLAARGGWGSGRPLPRHRQDRTRRRGLAHRAGAHAPARRRPAARNSPRSRASAEVHAGGSDLRMKVISRRFQPHRRPKPHSRCPEIRWFRWTCRERRP